MGFVLDFGGGGMPLHCVQKDAARLMRLVLFLSSTDNVPSQLQACSKTATTVGSLHIALVTASTPPALPISDLRSISHTTCDSFPHRCISTWQVCSKRILSNGRSFIASTTSSTPPASATRLLLSSLPKHKFISAP